MFQLCIGRLFKLKDRALKKVSIIFASTLFVISCSSNTQSDKTETKFLDLSAAEHSQLADEYWTISKHISPKYPASAARNDVSGCVNVAVGIGSDGRAKGYEVRSSYPKGVFDDYAVAALQKWRWEATEKNSGRTPILKTVQLNFAMKEAPDDHEYIENCSSKR
jgi:TonB family protein